MESDPQLESLSWSRDLEGDQSRVLTGEEGLEAPARAVRVGPLVQRELVVLLAREHLPVQLPPVEHLAVLVGSEVRVSSDIIPTTTMPDWQSTLLSRISSSISMSGLVTR